MIPGSNLLKMALSVIAAQQVTYFKYAGRALNDIGQDVAVYAPGVTLLGSWQPVPRQLYDQLGLDLQKEYFVFYVSSDILDLRRDISGDQMAFGLDRYQCQSNTEWYKIDGWKSVLCVKIPQPDTPGIPEGGVD